MRILFCGTQVPEEIEYKVKDISAAGNRFQNNIISNIRMCGHEVVERAYVGVPVPEEIKRNLKNTVIKEKGTLKNIIFYHDQTSQLLNDCDVAVCYNIIYAWLFLPFLARKKKVKSIAIIADYSAEICYSNIFAKLYAKLQRFSMQHFDTVVGLSSKIEELLKKEQKFILMEGGIDRRLYDSFFYQPREEGKPITLLYSGLLSPVTGVDKLLDLMKNMPVEKIQLLISGKGNLEKRVVEAQEQDSRIHFLGHLRYEKYIQQLQEADILLNPRNMTLPENQNNFPSKIMDYLASGKKIISTKFAGWERFDKHIVFCDTYEEMSEELKKNFEIADGAEAARIFRKNRELAAEFLWEIQVDKILEG